MALRLRSPRVRSPGAAGHRSAERVYPAPGAPEGVRAAELGALPVPLQMLVMEAWFRANFYPAPYRPLGAERDPALELVGEFGELVPRASIAALARALSDEARIWTTDDGLERMAAEARLGVVIASASPRFRPPDTVQEVILARLDAAEKALAKLRPAHGGIGHNNPPDGPLTPEEHAQASAAIAEVREEVSAASPDPSRARRPAEVLTKVAAAVWRWLWKRVEMATDEIIKKAVGPVAAVAGLDAMDAWQKLAALGDVLARWISQLAG